MAVQISEIVLCLDNDKTVVNKKNNNVRSRSKDPTEV